MASIRKRMLPSGKICWQVDYRDGAGKRRYRQFAAKRDADGFMVKPAPKSLPVFILQKGRRSRCAKRPICGLTAAPAMNLRKQRSADTASTSTCT